MVSAMKDFSLSKLSHIDKSLQIRDLAEKFGRQVALNDVHTPVGQGEGYAISSGDRDIGTISAPTTIASDIDWLAKDLEESCLPEELPTILHNLERAKSSLALAHARVSGPHALDLGGHREFVERNIREGLPSIENTLAKIATLNL